MPRDILVIKNAKLRPCLFKDICITNKQQLYQDNFALFLFKKKQKAKEKKKIHRG